MIRSSALALTLVLALVLAWFATRTPPPAPADMVKTAFSAARAYADVREIGRAAHPLESVDHARVRDYVADRLRRMGLQVRTQKTAVVTVERYRADSYVLGGEVENIIGVLPGRDPQAKAVVVEAHYDSVPNSPGAADDAAGVAAALETARALVAQGQPLRDVIFVISDGEENGLLGAHAFWEQDPAASHAGFVLNMDTRGGGGRAFMFETGRGNGQTIALFHKGAARPSSNSLAVFLYEHMPNGTDFTIPKNQGLQGLNFAFIGRSFDYHAASSLPERLDLGSLQHMGEQLHGVARELAFAPTLPAKSPDVVYGDLFGALLIAYPPMAGWLVVLVAGGLVGFALLGAWRRGEVAPLEIARGASGAVALLLLIAALFQLARAATGIPLGFTEQRPLLAQFVTYEWVLGALALAAGLLTVTAFRHERARLAGAGGALVVAVAIYLLTQSAIMAGLAVGAALLALFAFRRPVRAWSAYAGFLLVGLAVTIALQILAPTIAFVFGWPLLAAGVCALAASLTGGFERPPALLTCGLVAVVALGWLLAQSHGVALGVGADMPAALAVFAWLSILLLLPLMLATPRPEVIGGAAAGIAAVLIAFIGLHDPSSVRYPRATEVLYVRDHDNNRAYRAALTPRLDPWSRQAIQDGGAIRRQSLEPLARGRAFVADAPAVDGPRHMPSLESTPDGVTLALPQAAWIQLAIHPAGRLTGIGVQGRSVKLDTRKGSVVYAIWHTPQDGDPEAARLMLTSTGAMDVRYAVVTPGWPTAAGPPPRRPTDAMAWSLSDSTAEIGTLHIR